MVRRVVWSLPRKNFHTARRRQRTVCVQSLGKRICPDAWRRRCWHHNRLEILSEQFYGSALTVLDFPDKPASDCQQPPSRTVTLWNKPFKPHHRFTLGCDDGLSSERVTLGHTLDETRLCPANTGDRAEQEVPAVQWALYCTLHMFAAKCFFFIVFFCISPFFPVEKYIQTRIHTTSKVCSHLFLL